MSSWRIQFNVLIEQRQRSKKKIGFAFAFAQCKWTKKYTIFWTFNGSCCTITSLKDKFELDFNLSSEWTVTTNGINEVFFIKLYKCLLELLKCHVSRQYQILWLNPGLRFKWYIEHTSNSNSNFLNCSLIKSIKALLLATTTFVS